MKASQKIPRQILILTYKYSGQVLNCWLKKKISQPTITCSKLTIETQEQGVKYGHRSVVFIVNFEHISHLNLVFLLLTLNM